MTYTVSSGTLNLTLLLLLFPPNQSSPLSLPFIGADTMGHGGHVPPLSRMAGPGGHREQKNIKQEIAK